MTTDRHLRTVRRASTTVWIRIGIVAVVAACSHHGSNVAIATHPVVVEGQIPDYSCEPSFRGGNCNNYCLDLWQDYCYQRHPKGRIYSHRRCLGGCGLGCGFGRHCGTCQSCDSNQCGCGDGCSGSAASSDHPEPEPAHSHDPPAPPEPAVDTSAEIEPPTPTAPRVRPFETQPVTPPELRDPPVAPNPPEPPINDLPRNELPLLPVAQKAMPKFIDLNPADTAPEPRAFSMLSQPHQPPVPTVGRTEISNSGSLRLVEHLSDVSEVR